MKYLVTGGSGFIGTNLIEELLKDNVPLLNIDINAPNIHSHNSFWKNIDILDYNGVFNAFQAFRPTHVIHLAARTDTDEGTRLEDYLVNTKGTENILNAIKATDSVQKVIITSTQFVNQYHGIPKDEFDFAPHTVYGESKVIAEQLTHQAQLECVWTIIRPTNIWGPWHRRYPHEFWRVLGKGRYFHPGDKKVLRSYGYVKNVVYQIRKIFESVPEKVASRVYYLGDEPIVLFDWVDGFSIGLTGKKVRVVPTALVRILALCGDCLAKFNIKFPITSSRFKSMTTNNDAPMTQTMEAFGKPPYSLAEGINETVAWLKMKYPDIVKIR